MNNQPKITESGEAFIRSIETASALPLTVGEHLDLLDEISNWLSRAHIAHDQVWNSYSAHASARCSDEAFRILNKH